jgi:hypothetical protein
MGVKVKTVYFGGSRSLLFAAHGRFVARVVGAALAGGWRCSVGCAVGADQFVIISALAAGQASQLVIQAVGSQSGAGFWSGSALAAVRSAAGAGARVSWLAGGHQSLPLSARLIKRSLAGLVGCSAAVFFLASPTSSGSLRVAAAAAQSGKPVFVFSCGFSGAPRSLLGCSGAWVQSAITFGGVSFPCWGWTPSVQKTLF